MVVKISLQNGGGKNHAVPAAAADAVSSAAHALSRPAQECRAGRSVADVCQGERQHCVGADELKLSLLVFLTEQVGMCTLAELHVLLALACDAFLMSRSMLMSSKSTVSLPGGVGIALVAVAIIMCIKVL